jgi:hypothetical protein
MRVHWWKIDICQFKYKTEKVNLRETAALILGAQTSEDGQI